MSDPDRSQRKFQDSLDHLKDDFVGGWDRMKQKFSQEPQEVKSFKEEKGTGTECEECSHHQKVIEEAPTESSSEYEVVREHRTLYDEYGNPHKIVIERRKRYKYP
ncbi:hypothetical protein GEMRC1_006467 [Eukaryota sp. GEM-RC1]